MSSPTSRPLVSVCIPVYNGEKFLRQCVESISSQTFCDLEILVVDDCSTDRSFELAEQLAATDVRIRVSRNESNLGLVGNWNRCVEITRGRWIKFVFQDDWIAPHCIDSLISAAQQDTVLLACRRKFYFEGEISPPWRELYEKHGLLLKSFFLTGPVLSAERIQCFALNNMGSNPLGEPTAVMIRRDAFEEFGRFNKAFVSSCDAEFWMRVGTARGAVVVNEDLATFRVHGESTSAMNLAHQEYRTLVLDTLLLLYEYVHSRYYLRLREKAEERSIDLSRLLFQKQNEALAMALWASQPPTKDESLHAQLDALAKLYPGVVPPRLPHFVWRAKRRLASYFPKLFADRSARP